MKKGAIYKTKLSLVAYKKLRQNKNLYIPFTLKAGSVLFCLNEKKQKINCCSGSITRDLYFSEGYLFLFENKEIIVPEKLKKHEKHVFII